MSAWIWSQSGERAPPPPRKTRRHLQAVRRGVFEDVAGAAGGRLVEGPEQVAGAVRQRQPDDRAAGPAGSCTASGSPASRRGRPGPSAPGGDGRGLRVEDLVDVHAAAVGLGLLAGGEVAAVPVEDRAGGGLARLDRVQPLDRRVGVAPGGARAEDPRARLRQVAGARPDDHRDVAVAGGPHAEHAEIGVDPPLRHRRPGSRRPSASAAVAGRASPRRGRAGRSGRATCPAGRRARPPPAARAASRRRAWRSSTSRRRGSATASTRPISRCIIQSVHSTTRSARSIDLGLVPLEPERLREHPLGRDPPRDVAEHRIARSR